MILGNAAWGFRETPLEEQLKITRKMGLRELEISIAGFPANELQLASTEKNILKIKEMFHKYSVNLTCAATGNDFTQESPDACHKDAENVCRVIDICSVLGAQFLRIFAGFAPLAEVTGKRWDTMISCIKETATRAGKKGIRLSIETHGGVEAGSRPPECKHFHSVTTDITALKKLISETPDTVGFNYDPANLNAVGYKDPSEIYDIIKGKVNYIHLKDFTPVSGGWLIPAACGEGSMNWDKTMGVIKDFTGPAMIEYEIPADVEKGFMKSMEFLKKYL
jgi:sugar phosphate isomerase/epimerase